jgi:hypothetical protein
MRNVPGLLIAVALLAACGENASQPTIVPQLSIIAGNAQIDTIGKVLPTQIAAALRDKESGAPLAGRIVNWVVVDGGGSVFAPVVQTGADGIARQTWTLGMTPGGQTLVARWLNPDTGEPVTIDTARATAVPNWSVTVRIANASSDTTLFTWSDDGSGGWADAVPPGITRCERVAIRTANGAFHAATRRASYNQPVNPAVTSAYTLDVSDGTIVGAVVATQC